MARKYRAKTTRTYKAAPRRKSTRRTASKPRQQVVKIVLQHQMVGQQAALPVMGPDGPMALPAPKPKGSKL